MAAGLARYLSELDDDRLCAVTKFREKTDMRTARWLALCIAVLLVNSNHAGRQWLVADALAQVVVPQPIPYGFDFPAAAPTINGWVADANVTAIRGHAWNVWSGMTFKSGQTVDGKDLPIWETWYGSEDVFPQPSLAAAALPREALLRPRPRTLRAFVQPVQFHHIPSLLAAAAAVKTNIVSFNKFDPEAAGFIVAPQPGPGNATYSYNKQSSLQNLNQAWPAGTAGANRAINEFPIRAIETKPVFQLVKASGLTPQPLWQGPAGSTNPTNPTPNTWTTCVLIDPAGSGGIRPATAAEIAAKVDVGQMACSTYLYGPLSLLYSFKMTADEAAAFVQARGGPAVAGDYAVLAAMHVNTKEIPFWTWQTFYWQPGGDTPNGFPGSKAQQPATLAAPWNNYAMCANYNQTVKPGNATMDVCFNPYLETSPGIPAGITSNCMSCHGTARVANDAGYPSAYTAPIDFFGDATYFNTTSTHTDFSWAIPSAP
jgi:hypothetical protein